MGLLCKYTNLRNTAGQSASSSCPVSWPPLQAIIIPTLLSNNYSQRSLVGWSPLPACPTLQRLPSPAWEGEEHHCCDQRIIFTTNQTSKQPNTHIKPITIFARRGSGSYKGAYESDDDIAAKGQNNG